MAQHVSSIGPFGLRMPASLHKTVKRAAKENRRSMNSEIVVMLERVYRSLAATGEGLADTAPAAVVQNSALQGGLPITNGKGTTADEYAV